MADVALFELSEKCVPQTLQFFATQPLSTNDCKSMLNIHLGIANKFLQVR